MKKSVKSGLFLAMLMAGSAQAGLVKVNLTGTVSYGGQGSYDYNYNTGVYNSNNYSDLAGSQFNTSFVFDTAKAPDYSYSDSYSGSDYWWGGNYSYSYTNNYFNSALSGLSANVGGNSVALDNPQAVTQNYAYSYDSWGWSGTSNGAAAYVYNSNSTGNSYNYQNFQISNFGSAPSDVNNFIASLLSSSNPISFYLYNSSHTYNSDYTAVVGNYIDASGTFNSFSVSPVATPIPAAVWLFGSALAGLVGLGKRKKAQLAV